MKRVWQLLVTCSALWCCAANANWIERSNEYALRVMHELAPFQPEGAAAQGLDQYDEEIIDLKAGVLQRQTEVEQKLIGELRQALQDEAHPKVRQDLEILIGALEDGIESRKIELQHLLPYINLHGLVFQSTRALLDPRIDAERQAAIVTRLKKYAGLEAGYEPITALAQARTKEYLTDEALLGPYIKEMENDFADAPRYLAGVKAMLEASNLDGWKAPLQTLEGQLSEYQAWQRTHLLPRARASNVLPAAVYADNLKAFGVRATPEQLIEEALAAYQFIRSEMKALARQIAQQRGWKNAELVAVMRKLKAEQVPQDALLGLYQQRLQELEAIIEREQIVTLPERDASIRLATEAEAAAVPASFMSPPQLINNTGQYGEFVLVQTNPNLGPEAQMDDWSHDAITWALTVHEARPGHELQFASLVENGTSLARAFFAFNSANVEGWGLYAEAIMHEYLPLEAQLFSLFTRLMRAARMFLDPMVNTGQLTPEQAVVFMVEQTALSKPMASSEADRYAFRAPGQATSYYYGYQSLMRLRTELEVRLGDEFSQKAFHDFVLEQGLLPPELLREAVLEHFTR